MLGYYQYGQLMMIDPCLNSTKHSRQIHFIVIEVCITIVRENRLQFKVGHECKYNLGVRNFCNFLEIPRVMLTAVRKQR